MKTQTATDRALKVIARLQKELSGAITLQPGDCARIIRQCFAPFSGEYPFATLMREGEERIVPVEDESETNDAGRAIFASDNLEPWAGVFAETDFREHIHNDGSLVQRRYRSWLYLPVATKKGTEFAFIVARKDGRFTETETEAARFLCAHFSAVYRDMRKRSRKAAAIADETRHAILLRTQSSLGRKRQPFPGFAQAIDYSAGTGSDQGQAWRTGKESLVASVFDLTAEDAERQAGLIYVDTWFAILAQTSLGVAGMIRKLNADICSREAEFYASAAVIRYDRARGTAEISGCGSAVILFFSHDTMTVQTFGFGPAAGIKPGIEPEQKELAVRAGDIFCLCTDGLTDARKTNGDLVGADTIGEFVRRNYFLSAGDLAEKLLRSVAETTEAQMNADDKTVQILKIE